MPRQLSLCLLLCFSSFALAQNPASRTHVPSQPSSSPVQVVYVVDGMTIFTYNVDPQTLYATQVGTPLQLNAFSFYWLVPSPNDHFLYVIAYDSSAKKHLWVYTTDASGVPQTPATQEISGNGLYDLQIDPNANFLYAVYGFPSNDIYYTSYTIRRFVVDPTTGKISQPQIETRYKLPDGAEGTEYCGLVLLGFNPAANKLYDEVGCGSHAGNSGTYYEHTLNPQTGALGPDVQIYTWSNGTEGYEGVSFVNNLMFDQVSPNNYQQGVGTINVYPAVTNTTKPLLQCDAKMLEACGYSGGPVHPSGKYIFMMISQDATQIDKVELGSKKIVDTGNYIPYRFGEFSPDGTLVYGIYNSTPGYFIEIYGFDVATAGVTTSGGIIGVPSNLDPFFNAQRY